MAPGFLENPPKMLLFGGKGGVGKTTCATAAALHLARGDPRISVLLLSTDPAHSLQDSLGGAPPPERVRVVELDAEEHLDAFRREHGAQLREIADRGTFLDREDIDRLLSLSLPGMDELFAFLDLAKRAQDTSAQERIVVDTAPAGHTLRLLAMPELMRGWVDALDTLLAKHRYMRSLFQRRTSRDELDAFIEELRGTIDAADQLLRDPARCRFVPIMVPEELSVHETATLLGELDRLGIAAGEVVVNGLRPANACAVCGPVRAHQLAELRRMPAAFAGRTFWALPLAPREVRGPAALASFWDGASPLAVPPPPEPAPRPEWSPARVQTPPPLPGAGMKLLFFAGKGGVGKTTLACATAVRLAHERPDRPVLLFSTDPAHSVGECLDHPVGPNPTPIAAGLSALEIDARAEFEALKAEYRAELDEFFGSVLGGLDVPFDREVMERLLELSPPGVDEIMAISRAMDLLEEGRHAVFVLDAAPSGHLVRLLEMPELVERWLKAMFELFLKYRNVFHVPRAADRLVSLSRSLKRFRALLRDPDRAALYAVGIPTRMALDETQDLVAACARLEVDVPVLFLNLATAPSDCAFCRARVEQEEEVERGYERAFPRVRLAKVLRMSEPRGLGRLRELGDALYAASDERLSGPAIGP
jgi:arsenite-transporting ATPase